jgi:hypothetical protein
VCTHVCIENKAYKVSWFFFQFLYSGLVTGINCCPLPIADVGNGHSIGNGPLPIWIISNRQNAYYRCWVIYNAWSVTGAMSVTNDYPRPLRINVFHVVCRIWAIKVHINIGSLVERGPSITVCKGYRSLKSNRDWWWETRGGSFSPGWRNRD